MKSIFSKEIVRFAGWFAQDFSKFFSSLEEGTQEYFRSLSPEQKVFLKKDLQKLLEEFPGKSQKGIRNAWARLGAQWWDQKRDMRIEIQKWILSLS